MTAMTWHDMTRNKISTRTERCRLSFWRPHLGFLADDESTSHDRPTGIDTIKNFDRENLGTAVGILLLGLCHCALEVEISRSQKFFYYSVAGKRRKKLLPGQGVYNMPIFILSALCSQNSVYVEWSYFAPKCFNFYLHPSRFDKFSL